MPYNLTDFRSEWKMYKKIRGMSQSEIARKIDIDIASVSYALRQGRSFSKEKLFKILKSGLPLEPFILGLDGWEEILEYKREQCIVSVEDEKVDEILNQIEDDIVEDEKGEFNYPLNKDAYKIFVEYRIKIKKPVTPRSRKKDYKILREFDSITQAKMIQKSISEKWQGIFKLQEYTKKPAQTKAYIPTKDNETQSLEEIDSFFTKG